MRWIIAQASNFMFGANSPPSTTYPPAPSLQIRQSDFRALFLLLCFSVLLQVTKHVDLALPSFGPSSSSSSSPPVRRRTFFVVDRLPADCAELPRLTLLAFPGAGAGAGAAAKRYVLRLLSALGQRVVLAPGDGQEETLPPGWEVLSL